MRRAGNSVGESPDLPGDLPPADLPPSCAADQRAERAVFMMGAGAGLGLLLACTIAPTHPLLGVLGGSLAAAAYEGIKSAHTCKGPPP